MPLVAPRTLRVTKWKYEKIHNNLKNYKKRVNLSHIPLRNIETFFGGSNWTYNAPSNRWILKTNNLGKTRRVKNSIRELSRRVIGNNAVFYSELANFLNRASRNQPELNRMYNSLAHNIIVRRHRTPSRSPPKRPRHN